MKGYRCIVWLLLIVLFSGMFLPTAGYAFSLTSPTVNDDGNKSMLNVLAGLFLSDLLTKIFHIDLGSLSGTTNPTKTTAAGSKEVIGFYAEWWGTDTSSYDDLAKHKDAIRTIAPFWATLQEDGSLSNRGGNDHASVVNYAQNNNITPLLMINNAKQDSQDRGIHAVLSNSSLRTAAIRNIEDYIKQYKLAGINIDFEMVSAADRDNLTAFMRELSARLKPQGYIVSTDGMSATAPGSLQPPW